MDISVVIAAHNQRDRLRLVLSGLAVQTFSEGQFEVIAVSYTHLTLPTKRIV